jgi:hypothetical protein
MNLFVDVGEKGDDQFLVDGLSGAENWGDLPPDAFGATDRKRTVRWITGLGDTTTFIVPFSPHREHVLRLEGSSLWPNHVTVSIDGLAAAELDLKSGDSTYEVKLPAEAVGGRRMGVLALKFARTNIPQELDPEHYKDPRVCNLALDWVQLATSNLPLQREQNYKLPEEGVQFAAGGLPSLAGKQLTGPYVAHEALAPAGRVLSVNTGDGTPRDMQVGARGNVLFVNGLFSGVSSPAYLAALLKD